MMHGRLLCELRRLLVSEHGEDTWEAVLEEAPVPGQLFVRVTDYPDEHYYGLLSTAADLTDQDAAEIERTLGRRLATDLLDDTEVDDLGFPVLDDVEDWAGPALSSRGVDDGTLAGERLDDYRVRLVYDCPRGLCQVVRGLVDGVADLAGSDLVVEETECMHDGDRCCTFMTTAAVTATPRPRRPEVGVTGTTD